MAIRVYYESGDGQIHELALWGDNTWHHLVVTTVAGGPPAAAATALTSTTYNGDPRVYYESGDGQIHELALWGDNTWHHLVVTTVAGGPPAAAATALTSTTYNGDPRVYYESGDGQIHELALWGDNTWHHLVVTTAAGGPPAAAATALTSTTYNGDPRVYYESGDGQIHELALWGDNTWHHLVVSDSTAPPNPNALNSTNWSGYVAGTNLSQPQANSVTAVSGSWIVPTVTGPTSGTTYSSVWVGIDGYGNSTVEQLGTEEDVVNGSPVYRAWWEMYSSGKGQPEQVITSMTVVPGDSITASVQYITSGAHAGQFYLSIVDSSRSNDSFSTYESSSSLQSPLAQRSCAEWIVEAPSDANGNILPVANFGTVTFTNATAVINGVSGPINPASWQSQALNIGSNGVVQDTTSVLVDSGTSFVVTYNSSAANAVSAGPALQANTQVGTTFGATALSSPKVVSPAVGRPAWIGASVVSRFRIPPRQFKQLAQGVLNDFLWN